VLAALTALGHDVTVVWPLLSALCGLVVAGAGAVTARSARSWPAMGTRYDRVPVRTDPWAAMDRGEDPTEDDRA
jgi:hypothetical protein